MVNKIEELKKKEKYYDSIGNTTEAMLCRCEIDRLKTANIKFANSEVEE